MKKLSKSSLPPSILPTTSESTQYTSTTIYHLLTRRRGRLQYELTQHPKLLAQLPGSLLGLLQAALESSRNALALRQDNPDVLLYVYSSFRKSLFLLLNRSVSSNKNELTLIPCQCSCIPAFQPFSQIGRSFSRLNSLDLETVTTNRILLRPTKC